MEHRLVSDIATCIIAAWVIAVISQLSSVFKFIARLLEATDILHVLDAAQHNLLDEKRKAQTDQLADRTKVIP